MKINIILCHLLIQLMQFFFNGSNEFNQERFRTTTMSTWKEAAKAHGEFFSDIRPACTFVEVRGFINKEWLVETEADCVISEK